MNFDKDNLIKILSISPRRLSLILKSIPEYLIKYQPTPSDFSINDVLGHLIHGEKVDWIPRLKLTIDKNQPTFEPFDRFAHRGLVKGKSVDENLRTFEDLRVSNLKFLESIEITEEILERTAIHPSLGEVTILQLLNTWINHDLSHLNQINRILSSKFSEVGPWEEYLRIRQDFDG